MSRYQYTIALNDSKSKVMDDYPDEQWGKVEEFVMNRGGYAVLNRRLVSESEFDGANKIGNLFVGAWHVYAELES